MAKIYLTTAIPYVNGTPHIGHAMDYLNADVFARYHQLQGDEVRFQAGTDEHGNKIFQKAAEQGIAVEDYVAENSQKFQDFIKLLGVKNTDFIRTTSLDHERRCQAIWQKLQPHIYKDTYEGWYCTGCERFITDKEVADNHGVCPDHQKPYEKISEENYYFRISDFKDQIGAAITNKKLNIIPEFRAAEILKLLKDSPDVSISRPRGQLSWGVPVPGDDDQVMYVWVDALSNYITILGYPEQDISEWWPAAAQFVGKDILRFHAIIWPAMLIALGLPFPKAIHVHGHVLAEGQKMSKSIGNVVNPLEVLERHGLPAFRYYFLRHVDTFADSDFTWDKFEAAYNNELANDYGNLVQRLATLASKNNIPAPDFTPQPDPEYTKLMDEFKFSKAFEYAWAKLQDINRKIDETKPWQLAKNEDKSELVQVMQSLISDLLQANHLIKPFLPDTSSQVEEIFTGEITIPAQPLFPKN